MYAFLSIAALLAFGQPDPAPAADVPPSREPATPAAAPAPPPMAAPPPQTPAPPPAPPPASAPPAIRTPTANPTAPKAQPHPTEPEKAQVARAALRFLDALVAGDADGLAAAAADRFSFDGEVQTGREAVRRTWRALLGRREAPPAALLDLDLLPAPEAVARYGAPPARVAALPSRGAWVGVANVSGRPVVLFLVKDGGRWSVAGMHD